jgi:hypothetical protein
MLFDLKNKKIKFYLILLLGLTVAFVSLIPRLDGNYFTGKYLWAEDGDIFINQAQSLGLSSIWTPYAGYIHAYPRLISFIGSFFELKNQPYILVGGWAFAFAFMVTVIVIRAVNLGLNFIHLFALVALVALQPNFGEVFFNITNSQWVLGAALTIYVLASTDTNKTLSFSECILLAFLCFTGPFSILIAPLLMIHGLMHKNFKQYIWLYLTVLFCALIQAGVLINSHRIAAAALDPNLGSWSKSLWSLISFGANSPVAFAAASLFWVSFVFTLAFPSKDSPTDAIARKKVSLLLLSSAAVNILAALYSSKANPMAIVALGGGNRYTWIPYTLIFFSAIIATIEFKKVQNLIILSIGVICYLNFHPVSSPNLQFKSYANFSNYQRVVIPINPQEPTFPGWHIDDVSLKQNSDSIAHGYKIEYDTITSSGITIYRSSHSLNILSNTNNPILIFNKPISCPGTSDIGVEIEMVRSNDGWTQMFWDQSKNFAEVNSIRRFYPAGKIKAQFAFPNFHNGLYVRFDPLEQQGKAQINKIVIYCLP